MAKEARLGRKAAKGKEFMQTNICDISSLHTPSPIPLLWVCQMLRWGLQKQRRIEGIFLVSTSVAQAAPLMAMWSPRSTEMILIFSAKC